MADDPTPDEEQEEHEHNHGAEGVPLEQEERIVDKVVAKVKDVFQEIAGSGGRSDGGDENRQSSSGAPAGPAATEADMERQVREGVAKEITAREKRTAREQRAAEHDAEHERMRSLVETPPKTFSKLTTAIWGADDS